MAGPEREAVPQGEKCRQEEEAMHGVGLAPVPVIEQHRGVEQVGGREDPRPARRADSRGLGPRSGIPAAAAGKPAGEAVKEPGNTQVEQQRRKLEKDREQGRVPQLGQRLGREPAIDPAERSEDVGVERGIVHVGFRVDLGDAETGRLHAPSLVGRDIVNVSGLNEQDPAKQRIADRAPEDRAAGHLPVSRVRMGQPKPPAAAESIS